MQNAGFHGFGDRGQLLERVQLLSELNRHQEAITLLHQALGQSPQDVLLLCLLAAEFLEIDDAKSALTYADQAVAADPDEEWGHRLRSIALIEFDRVAALNAAHEAARRMPEARQTLQNLIHALLANNRKREAWEISEKLYALYPDDTTTYSTLASVAFAHEWFHDAERLSGEALKRSAANPHAHYNRGAALFNLKRYRESAESFARATELDPTKGESRSMTALATDAYVDSVVGPRVPFRLTSGILLTPGVLWFLVMCIILDGSTKGLEAVIGIATLLTIYAAFLNWRRHQRWRSLPQNVRRIYLITRWSSLRKFAPELFDRILSLQTSTR